ncbi:hypothetical protein FHS39_002113 [Streptomyces olivoverticillatus]|uniref:Chaplin domain-containing protein n=1 Tax=Streptomyces olivoverticillatus TaxID=66427 RepID=A0A7W7PKD2_9ACTN|nr:chaplin [Streptomyces olivoverticillatus]MBB4893102.1 hypothetical protein [Streptomyces olivoverticillatus]
MNNAKKAALALAAAGVAVGASVVPASADSDAFGVAKGSPGVISGNVIQVPIQIPINICGNTIDVVSLLNPTFGNTCINADTHPVMHHEEEHHEFHHHGREGRESHGHGREGREGNREGREGRE